MSPQQTTNSTGSLDPQVVNLAKAIRETETRGQKDPYTARGASGEFGAYQYTKPTWDADSRAFLGRSVPLEQADRATQNEVAYKKIKSLKDQGYNPAQIASIWNSGQPEWEGKVGTNKHGVKYDVPQYVDSVTRSYQALKSDQQPQYQDTASTAGKEQYDMTLMQKAGEVGKGAVKGLAGGILSAAQMGEGLANQTAGRLVSGVLGRGFRPMTPEERGDNLAVSGSPIAQRAEEGLKATNPYQLGGKIAEGAAEFLVPAVAGKRVLDARKMARWPSELVEALTPRLTGKGYEKAGLKGLVQAGKGSQATGLTGEAMQEVQRSAKAIERASSYLGIKPQSIINTKAGENTGNMNRIGDTIKSFSEKIVRPFVAKSGVNYNFTDLQKTLNQVQPPHGLSGKGLSAWNRMKSQTLDAIANRVSPDVKDIKSLSQFRKTAKEGAIPEKILKGDEDFWDARKMIDDIFEKETKGKMFGDAELNGAKEGYRALRSAFKDYLSEAYRYPNQMEKVNRLNEFLLSPQGKKMNKVGWKVEDLEKQFGLVRRVEDEATASKWDEYMDTLSGLYDAQKNIATKIGQERGMTGFGKFEAQHPRVSGLIQMGKNWALPGGIGAFLGSRD